MDDVSWSQRFWRGLIGFFVRFKVVPAVLLLLGLFASAVVLPFDVDTGTPRDPVPVDAIPDIGENQQIVFTKWDGRSPRDIEDQITYPLTTSLLGIPGVRTVRSFSMFGFSTIYVIFEDGVDFYWSRSRVLEKLDSLPTGTLPEGVAPALGPDATALGQVFWYTLEGRDADGNVVGGWELHELRSVQDWMVRYGIQSVPGVSEVASVGGYVQEYQVDVNPEAMLAAGVSIEEVANAVRSSNLDVGARTVEINQIEYIVRGVGFIENIEDIEQTVIVVRGHVPIRIKDVATVSLGPAGRRGALDNAGAETVGGVVVARFGENPLEVIRRVKGKIAEIQPGLPTRTLDDGTVSQVTIVPFYDRTQLIEETLGTLSTALYQQILITIIVVLVLLRNLRSSVLISGALPVAVLLTFVGMKALGVDANIMSLAGIAIAIGTLVDMGIVFVENVVRHLDEADPDEDSADIVTRATAEVAPAVVTSVLTTVVSFLPVFALTAAEGKLFTPVAWTKTLTLAFALLVALIGLPAAAHLLLWRQPGPLSDPPSGWPRRVLASVLRGGHVRDAVVVVAGLALMVTGVWLGGAFVVLVGLLRFARPLLPQRASFLPDLLENGLAVLAVLYLVTSGWLPLGEGSGLATNLTFVAVIIGSLLLLFVAFIAVYDHLLSWVLEHKLLFLAGPAVFVVVAATMWLGFDNVFGWLPSDVRTSAPVSKLAHKAPGFGREFMPPFDEGSYLYMPTTMSHASFGEAMDTLRELDAAIKTIPEVEEVVGKIGRVDSALDPAPVSMIETVVTYKPEYRTNPDGTRVRQWRDHIRKPEDIWAEITRVTKRPGVTGAPELMPINARIVMLQSGMRAPMGLKIRGPDLETIEKFGLAVEEVLKQVPSVRGETVFAERIVGKPYLEIEIDREQVARCGLTIRQVNRVIQIALGGQTLTYTVEGRERYPVRVRYAREERDTVEALRRVLIPTPSGDQIPLEQVAEIRYVRGPQVIKAEDTFLTGYVIFDKQANQAETDVVEQAAEVLQHRIDSGALVLPPGVSYSFAGSYENQVRSEQRLMILIPVALALILMLLYLQFRRVSTALVIYSGVAVAISGGMALIWLYNQTWFLDFTLLSTSMRELFQVGPTNMSVAIWVGFIALIGIATDDGVVMMTYISQLRRERKPATIAEIRAVVREAGSRRVRPCLMTTATTLLALLPVVTSQGRGSDVMVAMALPALGGMGIELVTLFVVPALYTLLEETRLHTAHLTASLRSRLASELGQSERL